jgi:hypothetical protein
MPSMAPSRHPNRLEGLRNNEVAALPQHLLVAEHLAITRDHHLLAIRTALVPPNAKEFDITVRMFTAVLPSLGT